MTNEQNERAARVAKVIAKAMGDNFADAFKNKQRWTAKHGMSGGRFRDVNEPFQADYLAAAEAATAVIAREFEALEAEVKRLREELRLIKRGEWFYLAGDMSSDRCRFSPYEVIDEDWLYDNRAEGSHVIQIEVATHLPDIWCAVRFFTDAEKEARQSDDEYELTEHDSEEAALAALGASHD